MPLTERFQTLILRGLLAGLIAGLLAGAVAFALGEPHIDAAIAIEEANAALEPAEATGGHSHDEEEALVSRTGQRFGLFLATTLFGIAIGAIFATVVHFMRRYLENLQPIVVAGGAWLAVVAVPFFKYPANPPAVGNPETIDHRTLIWLASVVLGLLAITAATMVYRRVSRLPLQIAAAAATFVAFVAVGYTALPDLNEVAAGFPATLLWDFRVASLATQLTLWLCLGIAFAALTEFANKNAGANQLARTSV